MNSFHRNLTDILLSPGDTIYRITEDKVYDWIIEHIEIYKDEVIYVDDSDNYFNNSDIGISVFLSKEDALAKLV